MRSEAAIGIAACYGLASRLEAVCILHIVSVQLCQAVLKTLNPFSYDASYDASYFSYDASYDAGCQQLQRVLCRQCWVPMAWI